MSYLINEFNLESEDDTTRLAILLGKILNKGDAIALNGSLGAGKTHFARGIARGLGVDPDIPITSPTFTLINIYEGANAVFYHIDLYRLSEADELIEIGFDEIIRSDGVTAIEWWSNFPEEIPSYALSVDIEITGDFKRRITFSSLNEVWNNRLKDLKMSFEDK